MADCLLVSSYSVRYAGFSGSMTNPHFKYDLRLPHEILPLLPEGYPRRETRRHPLVRIQDVFEVIP